MIVPLSVIGAALSTPPVAATSTVPGAIVTCTSSVLRATGSLALFFLTLGGALALYGTLIALAIWRGVWFRDR